MRKAGFIILMPVLAVLAVLSGCAHQPPAPPPEPPKTLFAMFQKYCVTTGNEREAMAKALSADGYVDRSAQSVLRQIMDIQSITWQKGKDSVIWGPVTNNKITADGKKEIVPLEPPGAKGDWCSIRIHREHDDSQSAIAKWAGIPVKHRRQATEFGDEISDFYGFRLENGKHIAIENYELTDRSPEAVMAGTWGVFLYKRGTEYGLSMSHLYMPKSDKAS